jgi:hypothetical protein
MTSRMLGFSGIAVAVGLAPEIALAAEPVAMVMLDPANPPEYAHPLAWAPFVLAGQRRRRAVTEDCRRRRL